MGRILAAVRENPFVLISALSGAVTILGTAGILSAPLTGIIQGVLSVALGLGTWASMVAAHHVIQKRAVNRALTNLWMEAEKGP